MCLSGSLKAGSIYSATSPSVDFTKSLLFMGASVCPSVQWVMDQVQLRLTPGCDCRGIGEPLMMLLQIPGLTRKSHGDRGRREMWRMIKTTLYPDQDSPRARCTRGFRDEPPVTDRGHLPLQGGQSEAQTRAVGPTVGQGPPHRQCTYIVFQPQRDSAGSSHLQTTPLSAVQIHSAVL